MAHDDIRNPLAWLFQRRVLLQNCFCCDAAVGRDTLIIALGTKLDVADARSGMRAAQRADS